MSYIVKELPPVDAAHWQALLSAHLCNHGLHTEYHARDLQCSDIMYTIGGLCCSKTNDNSLAFLRKEQIHSDREAAGDAVLPPVGLIEPL
jgi:hypothetical protein